MPLQSFQETLNSLDNDEKPSILLANGFSQAWDSDIFSYANLLDQADFGGRNVQIKGLFDDFDTYDFEQVMNALVAAEKVGSAYGIPQAKIDEIKEDQNLLKEALIAAISNSHPSRPYEVNDDQYESARHFIRQFNQIFTLNYDLLLYWARNKNNLEPEYYRTDDGFRAGLTWQPYGTNQEVHFLHGGLHIYDTGESIKKHAYTEYGDTIVDQVRENLEDGKFPLFVSEPTYQAKLSRIEHNPYLNNCFKALKELTGTLYIYGHSMDENDKHIFDQIKESDVSKVFVSLYGDENSPQNTRTRANARAFIESVDIEVEFFQAETAPIWS